MRDPIQRTGGQEWGGERTQRHIPLDPLSVEETSIAAQAVRAHVAGRWPLALRVDRAAGAEQGGRRSSTRATRSTARRTWSAGTATTATPTGASRSPTRALPGRSSRGDAAEHDGRRVARVRRGAAERPAASIEALARARDHRPGPGPDRRLDLRRVTSSPSATAAGGSAGPTSGTAARRRRQPVRQPGQRAALRRRPQLDGAARDRGHLRRRRAAGRWASTCRSSCRARSCATTSSRSRSCSPRACRSRSTATCCAWQNWSLRLGFNYREGLVLHTVGYEDGGRVRPIAHRLSFAEMVVPYRDPTDRPLPPHRLRHRRVGPRLHDDVARARLRLPRRDPLPRRGAARLARASRTRSRTRSASTRRTTPSSGSTSTRSPAPRSAGCGGSSSRSTSPSPTTSTSSTGASTRTATSSARCAPPGSWSRRTSRTGEQPPYGTLVDERTYAPFHQHFIVARLDLDVDGEDNTVVATESEAPPIGAGQPLRARARAAQHAAAHRAGGQAGLRLGTQRGWKVVNPSVANALGTPVGYKLVPGGALPADARPGDSPVLRARPGDRPHAVGHAVSRGRALAVRRVRQPERRGRRACRRGRRRTARSRTPTSCSGTSSASTTSRAPEDWPVMPVDIGLVLAEAVRLLRPQPRARRPSEQAVARRGLPLTVMRLRCCSTSQRAHVVLRDGLGAYGRDPVPPAVPRHAALPFVQLSCNCPNEQRVCLRGRDQPGEPAATQPFDNGGQSLPDRGRVEIRRQ